MKNIGDVVRKVIAQKHLGREMIGAITMNVIRDHFSQRSIKSKVHKVEGLSDQAAAVAGQTLQTLRPYDFTDYVEDKREIEGYVKFNKIFIKTSNQGLKIEIFKKKQEILTQVNEALANVGYATKMVEILIK